MNENSNNVLRSTVYKSILGKLKKLKPSDPQGSDSHDHSSAANELEQLFLDLRHQPASELQLPDEELERLAVEYFHGKMESSEGFDLVHGWKKIFKDAYLKAIADIAANETLFRNFIRSNHLTAQWDEFYKQNKLHTDQHAKKND